MFLLKIISRFPFFLLYRIADLLYVVAYHLLGYRKKVVLSNLRNSFPGKTEAEIKKIASGFYRHLADVIVETLKLRTISEEEFKKRMQAHNLELPRHYLSQGISCIVMAGHQANWEWLAAIGSVHLPSDSLYIPLANTAFDKLMLEIRSGFGAHMIPFKMAYREIVRRKDMPRCFGLMGDQSPEQTDYWTTFLNQETGFLIGSEQIAKKHNLPVLYFTCRRIRRGYYEGTFELLAAPPYRKEGFQILDAYKNRLEREIQAYPSDWLWSHKRWKRKRPEGVELR